MRQSAKSRIDTGKESTSRTPARACSNTINMGLEEIKKWWEELKRKFKQLGGIAGVI